MPKKVKIYGKDISDKHTHYEVPLRDVSATIIIIRDIAKKFADKDGSQITEYESFEAEVDFIKNDERVKECQNPFLPASHLMGSIASLEDLIVNS